MMDQNSECVGHAISAIPDAGDTRWVNSWGPENSFQIPESLISPGDLNNNLASARLDEAQFFKLIRRCAP